MTPNSFKKAFSNGVLRDGLATPAQISRYTRTSFGEGGPPPSHLGGAPPQTILGGRGLQPRPTDPLALCNE